MAATTPAGLRIGGTPLPFIQRTSPPSSFQCSFFLRLCRLVISVVLLELFLFFLFIYYGLFVHLKQSSEKFIGLGLGSVETFVEKIFQRAESEGRELTLEEVLLLSEVEDVLFELKNGNPQLVKLYMPPAH